MWFLWSSEEMCSEAGLVGKGAVSVTVCMEQGVASRPLSLDLYSF